MLEKSKVSSAPSSDALELAREPGQPVGAQPVEVDPLLPVDGVRAVRADRHRRRALPRCRASVQSQLTHAGEIWLALDDVAGLLHS